MARSAGAGLPPLAGVASRGIAAGGSCRAGLRPAECASSDAGKGAGTAVGGGEACGEGGAAGAGAAAGRSSAVPSPLSASRIASAFCTSPPSMAGSSSCSIAVLMSTGRGAESRPSASRIFSTLAGRPLSSSLPRCLLRSCSARPSCASCACMLPSSGASSRSCFAASSSSGSSGAGSRSSSVRRVSASAMRPPSPFSPCRAARS
mmetsp:Transcript_27394/g.91115  ORF Transcript_27394/g.91115 Transcript_27394/m.91115 type:complete len:205 (-) Transcript_27394:217-831(-)